VWDYVTRFTAFTGYQHRVYTTHRGEVFPMPINLRLAVHVELTEDDCGIVGRGGQQMPPRPSGPRDSAKGFAFRGDDPHLFGVDVMKCRRGTQNDVEPIGIEALQGAPDRLIRTGLLRVFPACPVGGAWRGRLGPLGDRDE